MKKKYLKDHGGEQQNGLFDKLVAEIKQRKTHLNCQVERYWMIYTLFSDISEKQIKSIKRRQKG
ncbi:hypothetical protein ABPH35_00590 [Streptococcus sp. ZJ93]|uniref:hypothetical protein n=1 Tax=Streptococcus handemini TaxID=3161188 RepID=UPI0034D65B42